MFIPLFIGFQPSKVVQNFFHPQCVHRCLSHWLFQLVLRKKGAPWSLSLQDVLIGEMPRFVELLGHPANEACGKTMALVDFRWIDGSMDLWGCCTLLYFVALTTINTDWTELLGHCFGCFFRAVLQSFFFLKYRLCLAGLQHGIAPARCLSWTDVNDM